jgi:isopenicillin N synthase-like dioxygenase
MASLEKPEDEVPIVDLAPFMADPSSPAARAEIEKVARGLVDYGCLVIKDPRVDESHNDTFVDMLEKYFALSDAKRDARPEISFQVGVTPERTEVPRNHCAKAAELAEGHQPVSLCPPEPDLKMRFFW